ncbi:hypothetical protein BDY21DRAFT_33335 [Lineolata rhizophorae]|uniref:Uncharacterized protein n=1 Tax=Lineolata rhizophorae TaxID=578093 RepID=A0A6A6NZV2_9PEZI|nr:hypothetical protein BDY21DRAFT_33335 [Lineolata rhizophorae]
MRWIQTRGIRRLAPWPAPVGLARSILRNPYVVRRRAAHGLILQPRRWQRPLATECCKLVARPTIEAATTPVLSLLSSQRLHNGALLAGQHERPRLSRMQAERAGRPQGFAVWRTAGKGWRPADSPASTGTLPGAQAGGRALARRSETKAARTGIASTLRAGAPCRAG